MVNNRSRAGSQHIDDPITPISCNTVPITNESNAVTPTKNTVILYKSNNIKGTKQTRTKQTNMNLIIKE